MAQDNVAAMREVPIASGVERREAIKAACAALAPFSADAPGTATRDALVILNGALFPAERPALSPQPTPDQGSEGEAPAKGQPIYGPCGCDGFSFGHEPGCTPPIIGYASSPSSDGSGNQVVVPPQRVYIAARFSRRHECNALAHFLQERGHTITSRWVKPEADHVLPTGISEQAADDERRRFAMEDVEDVRNADWCISLMEEPRGNSRGGRHIEFGLALGLGKRLTIIGPRETVFHHLDQVEQFDCVEDFLAASPNAGGVGE